MMLKIAIVGAVLIAAFIIWRWTSVERGARQRDERIFPLINPIGEKLEAGSKVPPEEIEAVASHPEARFMLAWALRKTNRFDLFPTKYCPSIFQGESALVYWMMHPNELGDAPQAIEFVETLKRPVDGRDADFHVYRYKMPPGHWAADDGWILGVAGPMVLGAQPYSKMPGAFSRADEIDGKVKPAELVDWYVDMLRQKGATK